MLLGAIADDLTGATDLALTLSREGMRTVQVVGVPDQNLNLGGADAVVIALKSRTIPAEDAVNQSVSAARYLLEHGAQQLFFKYCSTFDSTTDGNIGPVADALLDLLGTKIAFVCPAFPTNGRTVYNGHLFVGQSLLSESPMKDHPLTPMRDPNLLRVLQSQSTSKIGLVPFTSVEAGETSIRYAAEGLAKEGVRLAVVDAISDRHLRAIGHAASEMKLVTGGSGVALGLPDNFRRSGKLADTTISLFAPPAGRGVMFAGSCSAATRRQTSAAIAAGTPTLKVDPFEISTGKVSANDVVSWVRALPSHQIPLIYSSADPAEVQSAQEQLGRERAGTIIEMFLGQVARELRNEGFDRFVVAGGETSGAVVHALGVEAIAIGPEIDPGVPWTVSIDQGTPVALALKSGNFGADDFFAKAWRSI
ncbi:3-oxo-tetronate kinase [Rhizobium sp. 18055]|uniref:3-oxo-tetronate kinase n=1 Tax=Rhizobium sp. 18055 TaxID=2681403 RepID=UPI00135BFA2D|nr:3-oxo-tetronate kinase [Rhizobium sp. 18055]